MKIVVVGLGYVGKAQAFVLARKKEVVCYDIQDGITLSEAIIEPQLVHYFSPLHLQLELKKEKAYAHADLIFLCLPTNLNQEKAELDVSILCSCLDDILLLSPQAKIVIKSTLPYSFYSIYQEKYSSLSLFYAPEFLRENSFLKDALFPSRIVLGYFKKEEIEEAKNIVSILKEATEVPQLPVLITNVQEAIAIKLFSNAYLAMRISFFNELDSFALEHHLNTEKIIEGMGYDPRIGNEYNQPSFAFKGYCLPKDTMELVSSFKDIPCPLISSILNSNQERYSFILSKIEKKMEGIQEKTIGFYRCVMEKNATTLRHSIVQDLMKNLKEKGYSVVLYEPLIQEDIYQGVPVIHSFLDFIQFPVIVANRMDEQLLPYKEKVFTRDLHFQND